MAPVGHSAHLNQDTYLLYLHHRQQLHVGESSAGLLALILSGAGIEGCEGIGYARDGGREEALPIIHATPRRAVRVAVDALPEAVDLGSVRVGGRGEPQANFTILKWVHSLPATDVRHAMPPRPSHRLRARSR